MASKLHLLPTPNWSNGWLLAEPHSAHSHPNAPSFWPNLSPQSIGTKDAFSSAEDDHCNHSEWSSSSLVFPVAQNPTTLTQNPQQVYRNCSHKWICRSTPAKCSTMESPWCRSTCCAAGCNLLCNLIISQLQQPTTNLPTIMSITMANNLMPNPDDVMAMQS